MDQIERLRLSLEPVDDPNDDIQMTHTKRQHLIRIQSDLQAIENRLRDIAYQSPSKHHSRDISERIHRIQRHVKQNLARVERHLM